MPISGRQFYFFASCCGRSLHGERGLKHGVLSFTSLAGWSLPSRGAWIETIMTRATTPPLKGRSLHGERGLKLLSANVKGQALVVAPFTGSVD